MGANPTRGLGVKMEIVLEIETENYQKVKDILLKDDLVSRASIKFREGKIIGKEGYFCYISGTEEQYKRAMELINQRNEETGEIIELAKKVENKEKGEIINKIKEEENMASEGMGNIFG